MMKLTQHEDFFAIFAGQARLVSATSALLVDEAINGNGGRQATASRIAELEEDGDEMVRRVAAGLNQSYRTPIEPEDVRALASRLDDVLDGIEDVAYRLVAYRFESVPASAIELCSIVAHCAKAMEEALQAIAAKGTPFRQCEEIDRLESQADAILRYSTASLLRSDMDPIAIIKLKELYERLEDTIDGCRHVSDTIRNILTKQD